MASLRAASPATSSRRAVSPGRVEIFKGPLDFDSTTGRPAVKFPKTPAVEAPLNLEEFIYKHIFKPLPSLAAPVPNVDYSDLLRYTTENLLARPTLYTVAILAERLLISSMPTDHERIFHLWILRLSSLSLLGLPLVAEAEAQSLAEFNTSDVFRTHSGHSVIPWSLRVLLVKIQTEAHGLLGITKYYSLAREARLEAWKSAKNTEDKEESDAEEDTVAVAKIVWEARLLKCGIYVAAMLAHIRDFTAAFEHVQALIDSCPEKDAYAKSRVQVFRVMALLSLEAGDSARATEWLSKLPDQTADPLPEIKDPIAELEIDALKLSDDKKLPPAPPPTGPPSSPRDALFSLTQKIVVTEPIPSTIVHGETTQFDSDKSGVEAKAMARAADNTSKCNYGMACLYDGRVETARTVFTELAATGYRFTDLIFRFCVMDELKHEITRISEFL
ncbi:hypothetical protein V1512DRAFT_117376 [Lipomyces arxii]|uniref:uncharacterized protein n=1 Tax=Lipomyces arxii TaxID=56418 RepID=UPI0034CF3242